MNTIKITDSEAIDKLNHLIDFFDYFNKELKNMEFINVVRTHKK